MGKICIKSQKWAIIKIYQKYKNVHKNPVMEANEVMVTEQKSEIFPLNIN